MKKVKLSELPVSESLEGLKTLGVDGSNRSVQVPFGAIKTGLDAAVNNANTAAAKANEAAGNANAAVQKMENAGYLYAGIATDSTDPGTPQSKVFYLATKGGSYTHFGADITVVEGELTVLKYNGSTWSKEAVGAIGGEGGGGSYELPIANASTLGGVKGRVKTNETVEVAVDPEGRMFVPAGGAGKDGITPHIGDNGNWFLDTEDTGKPSRGPQGDKGVPGANGGTLEGQVLISDVIPEGPEQDEAVPKVKAVKRKFESLNHTSTFAEGSIMTNKLGEIVKKLPAGTKIKVLSKSSDTNYDLYTYVGSSLQEQIFTRQKEATAYFVLGQDIEKITIYNHSTSELNYDLSIVTNLSDEILEISVKVDECNSKLYDVKELTTLEIGKGAAEDFKQEFRKNSTFVIDVKSSGAIGYDVYYYPSEGPLATIKKKSTLERMEFTIPEAIKGLRIYSIYSAISATISSKRDKLDDVDLNHARQNAWKFNSSECRFASLGDSITSTQVSNIGTLVCEKLGARILAEEDDSLFGNVACGFARLCDDSDIGGQDLSEIQLTKHDNTSGHNNVLSNQVLRLIQHITPLGEQIKWKVCSDWSEHTIPMEKGVGKGYIDDVPSIIYIAISHNDAKNFSQHWDDEDYESVIQSSYSDLTRISMYSALRWAIETLSNVFPFAHIIVATPLQSPAIRENMLDKRTRIIKMCNYLGVPVIDSTFESGKNLLNSLYQKEPENDVVHPSGQRKERIVSYITGRIRSYLNII